MLPLKLSKVIVVSGASSGFGTAIAKTLAKQGHTLLLGARRQDRLAALCDEINQEGHGKALFHPLDVREPHGIDAFSRWAHAFSPNIDVLVNNAGLALGKDELVHGNPEDWSTMWETNVQGVMLMSRAFLPEMIQRQRGHLVQLGSIAGTQGYSGGAGYCASKFALRAITETLRLETYDKGLRVSSIDPGMAETEFSLVRFKGDSASAQKVYEGVTALTAQDVADAVAYVISAPAHVNIDYICLTPQQQASAYHVHRHTNPRA